jgi:Rad52/22 family double-strand break repair protein
MAAMNRVYREQSSPHSLPTTPGSIPGAESAPALPSSIVEQLTASIPDEAISTNQDTGLASINQAYVIERLNQVFGLNGWQAVYEIVESTPMVVVKCRLTIAHYGIVREQFGGNRMADRGDAYKSACTDALGKCASQIGIGIDVYKGKYSRKPSQAKQRERLSVEDYFGLMHRVLGAERYGAILRKAGYRYFREIPTFQMQQRVFEALRAAFQERFNQIREEVSQAEYLVMVRDLGLTAGKLPLEQAVRLYETLDRLVRESKN